MIINALFPASVVREVDSWVSAHQVIRESMFDVALLDLDMPGEQAWERELNLFTRQGPTPVCVVSASDNQQYIHRAFACGARGYITKGASAQAIEQAVMVILQGNIYLPESVPSNAKPLYTSKNTLYADSLTPRQRELLVLLAEGKSNREIGFQLGLKEGTVKRHLYNIFRVLGVKSRTEAMIAARCRQ